MKALRSLFNKKKVSHFSKKLLLVIGSCLCLLQSLTSQVETIPFRLSQLIRSMLLLKFPGKTLFINKEEDSLLKSIFL